MISNSNPDDYLKNACSDSFDFAAALNDLAAIKKEYQRVGNEADANRVWSVEQIISVIHSYRELYSLVQNDDYYKAWCKAEEIEIAIRILIRNNAHYPQAIKDIDEMIHSFQSLFPYRVFMSTVIKIEEEICSICGTKVSIHSYCGHIPGYVYCGELCHRIVQKNTLVGVDVVTNPEHKYAVAFLNGEDHYDYSLVAYLKQNWRHPLQRWGVTVSEDFVPHGSFPHLKDEDLCPCNSGLKYVNCCKNNSSGIRCYHYQFEF